MHAPPPLTARVPGSASGLAVFWGFNFQPALAGFGLPKSGEPRQVRRAVPPPFLVYHKHGVTEMARGQEPCDDGHSVSPPRPVAFVL